MPFYYLVAVAVSKWFSQLKLLGIVSLLDETILQDLAGGPANRIILLSKVNSR